MAVNKLLKTKNNSKNYSW